MKNLSHPNMQHAALLNKAYRSGWIQGCRNCLCRLFFRVKGVTTLLMLSLFLTLDLDSTHH